MPGALAAAVVVAVVVAAVAGLAGETGAIALWEEARKPYTRAVIIFTLYQAAASTALAVGGGIMLARALARRRFFGRRGLLLLTGLAFVTPTMVAVVGIIAVHGGSGWVHKILAWAGISGGGYVYGLTGILLAHTFFNLPLAARIFLGGLTTIPQRNWNLAMMYGLRPRDIFIRLEWPLLRGLLPGVAGLIFLLCFSSFAVVLNLGGGPAATTLEVAIYQAIRFEFDIARAAALALLQIIICGGLVLVWLHAAREFPLHPGDAAGPPRADANLISTRIIDAVVLVAATVFLAAPLVAVVAKTFTASGWLILAQGEFWRSLFWTAAIALCAGATATAMALALCDAVARLRRGRAAVELLGMLPLLIPPLALGAGLWLAARRFSAALSLAPLAVILLNALLVLAFALRILLPAVTAQRDRYDNLCASLGVRGWWQWKILWREVRPAVGYAAAVATALAAGDMGVIALFGTDELSTLPLLIHRLLAAYRLDEAAVVAVVLLSLCAVIFWGMEYIRPPAAAK